MTVVTNTENPKTIAIPPDEMKKLGINNGDEIEISRGDTGEIVLRPKQNERAERVLGKTR